MSTTIERKEEYVLTRAQFEQLQANGQLVIGATYTITDDPTVEGIITGEEIAKKAERDASGNVITSTYRTVADSYTKTEVNNLIPTQASDVHALPDSTKYAANISVSGTTVQLKDQDGNDIGSSITTQDTGATVSAVARDLYQYNDYTTFTTTAEYIGFYIGINNNGDISYTLVTDLNKDTLNITPGTTIAYKYANGGTGLSYNSSNRTMTLTSNKVFVELNDIDNTLSTTSRNPIQNKVIAELIPNQASSSNQLADKSFVNSSISTATATFRGTYNLVTDLSLTTSATHSQIATAIATKLTSLSITPDNNDYCFIQIPTADATPTQITSIERYKFDGTNWEYEYTLNNSGFTASQWAAINSGITDTLVTQIGTNQSNITSLSTNKLDKVTSSASSARVYTINTDGTQSTNNLNKSAANIADNAIAQYDSNGNLFVNDPSGDKAAVNRQTLYSYASTRGIARFI